MTATSNEATIDQALAASLLVEGDSSRPKEHPALSFVLRGSDAQAISARALLLLAGVVLLGGIARFWNLDWDAGYYTLHPDEWALNQVVERLGSDLNPHFFFYGSFPIYLYRATAELLTGFTGVDWLDTSRVSLIGRFYSALGSTLMLPVIFLVGRRLWNATGGLLAASLTASAPLLIQAAHFGTVDTLVTLAAVVTLWLSLRLADGAGLWTVAAVGLVIGLAIATKLTAASFLLMPAIACLECGMRNAERGTRAIVGRLYSAFRIPHSAFEGTAHCPLLTRYLVLLGSCAVAALVASPYYVLAWSELWAAIREQTDELNGGYSLSYTWHFIGAVPYIFEGSNLLVWGLGLTTGIAGLAGWALSIVRIASRRAPVMPTLLLVLWPTLYFLYIGTWEARFVRHTLPLVPFICLFAAGALVALLRGARNRQDGKDRGPEGPSPQGPRTPLIAKDRNDYNGLKPQQPLAGSRRHRILSLRSMDEGLLLTAYRLFTFYVLRFTFHRSLVVAAVLVFSALWGVAFLSIYTSTNTRLAATDWFHANVPAGAHLVVEDKDTLVPLPDAAHPVQTYHLGVIEPTTPDSPVKLVSIASALAGGEFLVISSRRWSATIPRLPAFPITGRYYSLLFAGKLGYTPIATFSSPPRLGPLVFPDDSAEETFQVFDHPTVRIFRNTAHLPLAEIEQLLGK